MLRQNMTAAEAVLRIKQAFIKAAETEIKQNNASPTNARIAIITGLDRNEVSRMRRGVDRSGNPVDENHQINTLNRAAKVTTNWPTGDNNKPLILPFSGSNSFSELVRKHSGGIPAPSMLEELERNGAASRTTNGDVALLRRTFIPQNAIDKLEVASRQLERLLHTIDHNTDIHQKDSGFLQAELHFKQLSNRSAQAFAEFSKSEGHAILQKWAQEIEAKRQNENPSDPNLNNKQRCTGVGIYFFDDNFNQ